jgi:hypothetical protein
MPHLYLSLFASNIKHDMCSTLQAGGYHKPVSSYAYHFKLALQVESPSHDLQFRPTCWREVDGDGREFVVCDENAVKIRSEDAEDVSRR